MTREHRRGENESLERTTGAGFTRRPLLARPCVRLNQVCTNRSYVPSTSRWLYVRYCLAEGRVPLLVGVVKYPPVFLCCRGANA